MAVEGSHQLDPGGRERASVVSSLRYGTAITPHDDTVLAVQCLWVGGTGTLAVRFRDRPDTTVTLSAIPAGTLLPLDVVRVMAASTATLIIGMY